MLINSRSAAECEVVKSGRPGKTANPGRSLLCHPGRTGFFLNFQICVCMQSCFSRVQLFVTSWTVVRQAPWSMVFPRQEYWSGLPWPPLGDLPHLGIKPTSLTSAGGFFTTESPGKLVKRQYNTRQTLK